MSLIFIFSAVKLGYKSNRYQDRSPIVMDLRAAVIAGKDVSAGRFVCGCPLSLC